MQIQKIGFTPLAPARQDNLKKQMDNSIVQTSPREYKAVAYRDYNISFGDRLFRTPANFFAQPFNQKGMPETMKAYLNEDYSDRQNMPPYQMLQLVFSDISKVKTLEDVKRIYPDEPLFENLTDRPNRKVSKGLVAEIEVLRDETDGLPLFKNGDSNFPMYILKKIYQEGKTLKEINSDFKNDIEPTYGELIDHELDYSDLSAYGIKFPNNSFWKSFTANRENFPYTYKPRKTSSGTSEKRELSLHDILNANPEDLKSVKTPKPPKFKIEKHELDKFTDAFITGHGDNEQVIKALKKRGNFDSEKIQFIRTYMSEIMSVSLEKTQASDEMRNFFEKYNSLSRSQKDRLESYWRANYQMRALQSLAISDTIKLFFMTYGADGENEEFKELLDYAHSIKPNRIAQQEEHDRIQAEYDKMAEELAAQDAANKAVEEAPIETPADKLENLSHEELQAKMQEQALKNGAELFHYVSDTGEEFNFICNVDEVFNDTLKRELALLPTRFQSKYMDFMFKSPEANYEYKKSLALKHVAPDFVKEQLMSDSELDMVSINLNKDFSSKYPKIMLTTDQILAEFLLEKLNWNPKYTDMLMFNTSDMLEFANSTLKIESLTPLERAKMDKKYNEYLSPITNKADIKKINNMLMDYLHKLDTSDIPKDRNSLYDQLMRVAIANMKMAPDTYNAFYKTMRELNFVREYGGTAKILLRDDVPQAFKDKKCLLMLEDVMFANIDKFRALYLMSIDNINKYITDDDLRASVLQQAMFARNNYYFGGGFGS